jgi:hypothetical protein
MIKNKIMGLTLLAIFFDGCSSHNIKKLREVNQSEEYTIAQDRVLNIRYNETAYSKALEVYGEYLNEYLTKDLKMAKKDIEKMRIGVENIYDKTGKVFPEQDAISDMVLGAFTKLNLLPMVNLNKPSVYGNYSIPENLLSNKYKNYKQYSDNPQLLSQLPIGVLKPTDYYVAGALLQYDKQKANETNIDAKYLSFGRNFEVIDVALDLRLVDSSLGIIPMPEGGGKSSYISLQNRVITITANGEYMKLIDNSPYGIKISHNIGDPTQYAVREIVELAVLELVSKWTGLDWKKTDAINYVNKKDYSNFVVKAK